MNARHPKIRACDLGKAGGGSAVSSRFIFAIALSQFRGPDYLGASNKPGELTVVKLSESRTRKETPLL